MVTVGSAIGATIPTTFGQTKCNVLIDTGAMKSCMSQAYYQQLMLPATRSIHTFSIKSANGTNLCPIGQLISQQRFLVESLEVLMKGPMIHNREGIYIPGRNLAVVSVLLDTKTLQ